MGPKYCPGRHRKDQQISLCVVHGHWLPQILVVIVYLQVCAGRPIGYGKCGKKTQDASDFLLVFIILTPCIEFRMT